MSTMRITTGSDGTCDPVILEMVGLYSRKLIESEIYFSKLNVDTLRSACSDAIELIVSGYLRAEKVAEESHVFFYQHPDGWFESFKERYFPEWLKDRFPVKMKVITKKVTFIQKAVFPRLLKYFPEAAEGYKYVIQPREEDL